MKVLLGFYLSFFSLIIFAKCENEKDIIKSGYGLLDLWQIRHINITADIAEDTRLYREIEKEQQALSEIRHSMRRSLREENAKILSEILCGNASVTHFGKLQELYRMLMKNYDVPLIEDIFRDALDEVYGEKSASVLVDELWSIYQPPDENNSFEIMVRAQLILSSMHNMKNYEENNYLQKWALHIYKIKKSHLYNNLDTHLRSGIEKAIAQLPDYLNYLIFKPFFCMMNVAHSEFIYTAVSAKLNAKSRYIWLWYEKNNIDSTGQIKADIIDENFDDFKITLMGTSYNLYYYMMPNSNAQIAGLEPSSVEPFNHIWNVQFNDDKVILSQNEYIMCSGENYDASRRNINGYKNIFNFDAKNPICQWSIGNCDRRL